MHKKVILILVSLLFLFIFIFFTTAQLTQTASNLELINQGANLKTLCAESSCNTTVYSYDKYFEREGVWEEIDESWNICEGGYCTNNYYFNATASQNGFVRMYQGNSQFSQQITSFNNQTLSFQITPSINGNTITYTDIIPNIDLRYQYLPHKLKEEIIIKQPIQNLNGDIEIAFNLSNIEDLIMEKPFVCSDNNYCVNLRYSLNNNQISINLPSRFLSNENITYPVIIDPSFILGNSSIIWNGYVALDSLADMDENIYSRINNPSILNLGLILSTFARGDIDWNLNNVPNIGSINNATLYLYIENFTAPNFLNITHIEKNSSEQPNNYTGNGNFYNDMLNGTVYSNYYSATSFLNTQLAFSFNQQGLLDINTALSTDKRFSTGLYSDDFKVISISARDHPTPSQRPYLTIQHTMENYNLTYDANGNMVQGFGKYLEYDGWNRLSKIRNNNASGTLLAEYFYDHEGKRILKKVYNPTGNGHNESTYYMNTRPADFIQVVNTNGTEINETYIYLQDKLIAKIDTNNRKFFYHPDHLGSTSLVTNESGAVVEDLLYLPYGDILSGNELSRFGYTGQENDVESGFMDYGARQYNPQFARFLQPDPIISDIYNPQNLNRYSYVLNNPYKYTDPDGKQVVETAAVGVAGWTLLQVISVIGYTVYVQNTVEYTGKLIGGEATTTDHVDFLVDTAITTSTAGVGEGLGAIVELYDANWDVSKIISNLILNKNKDELKDNLGHDDKGRSNENLDYILKEDTKRKDIKPKENLFNNYLKYGMDAVKEQFQKKGSPPGPGAWGWNQEIGWWQVQTGDK